MFLLPAFLICRLSPCEYRIETKRKTTAMPVFTILGTIGIISIVSRMSSYLLSFASVFGIGFHSPSFSLPNDPLGIILFAVYSALIPAIVEELLFRKVILERLVPFGKSFALVFSALLFSLMHCNPSQYIYAFAGGLILGKAALMTNSIFFPFVIHLSNNLLSVFYIILYNKLPISTYQTVSSSVDLFLRIIGLLLICILLQKRFFERKEAFMEVGFSRTVASLRLFFILYLLYSLFLSLRWVYII